MSKFIPSEYNLRIRKEFKETNNNIVIQAVAGSGKTTALVDLIQYIPSHKDAIFIAFNKHIVETLKERVGHKNNLTISTINSFGARMLYRTLGKISLVENKYFLIALRLFKNKWELKKENKWSYCYNVSKIVDVMRFNFCFDDDDAIEESCTEYGITILKDEIEHARQVFSIGLEDTNKIDFLDQVFLPVVRKIKFIKFHYVLCDEIQDFSKLHHQFIKKLVMPGLGRHISVGDRNQSIYHFSGASSNSFDAFLKMYTNTVELPLSICYRCGVEMIKLAQELVPQIQPAPAAIAGKISKCDDIKKIRDGDVVLCRTTRPLVIVCRDLIKQGRKAVIKGREIGENLLILIRKTKATTIEACLRQIAKYESELRIKLLKKGVYQPDQHKEMLQLVEKKEIIKALAEGWPTLAAVVKRIEQIFVEQTDEEENKGILLMTAHRSKGLEWDRVWFLNKHLIPSPYAMTKEQIQQEYNLLYVIYTRAKKEFIYINVDTDKIYQAEDFEDDDSPF